MERYQPRSKYICDNSKLVLGDFNVDDLNKHFITTANRLLKSEHLEPQDILKTLELYQIKLQKPTSIYNTSHINKLKKNSKIFV